MKTKAILLLTTPRTGSNHLTRLMHNFDNIDVNWEIFGYDHYNIKPCYRKLCTDKFGENYEENIRKNDLQIELIKCIKDACKSEFLILKLFLGDYSDKENHIPKYQIEKLLNDKIIEYVIILNRRNKIDQYISLQKAIQIQKWDSINTDKIKINFNIDGFKHYKKRHEEIYNYYKSISSTDKSLQLVYEDDIYNSEHLLSKINHFIIDLKRKTNSFEKGFEKQDNETDYSKKIENYDEVKDFLSNELGQPQIQNWMGDLHRLVNYHKLYQPGTRLNQGAFLIDKEILTKYASQSFLWLIISNYVANKDIFEIVSHREFLTLDNVYVTRDGLIKKKDTKDCFSQRRNWERGCCDGELTRMRDDAARTCHWSRPSMTSLSSPIISIARVRSSAFYHFAIECFLSLSVLPDDLVQSAKIHVGGCGHHNVSFIQEMFHLINIPKERLIFGDVYAPKAHFPVMNLAETLHNSYCHQWYRGVIDRHLDPKNEHRYVILVKRSSKRGTANFAELREALQAFADEQALELYIHDDATLPSIVEQFNVFNQAKYVFGPHGAAGILIPAMRRDSWFVEFIKSEWYEPSTERGGGENMARLAWMHGINYYMSLSHGDIICTSRLTKIIREISISS